MGVFKTFVGLADQVRSQRPLDGMEKHGASEPATDGGDRSRKENQDGEDSAEAPHMSRYED